MVNVRGVNVFPAAIESVVRQFREIGEFRSTVTHQNACARCRSKSSCACRAASDARRRRERASRQQLREALGLTIPVQIVPPGTLPQFDMKARRMVIEG